MSGRMDKIRLLKIIFGDDISENEIIQFLSNFDEALSTLAEREIIILNKRLNGMTFKETGLLFDVTPERIRQIQEKAIRRLCHPARKNIFLGLKTAWNFSIQEEKEEIPQDLMAIAESLENVSIFELELSTRSFNCLNHQNIHSIGKLILKTEKELLETKNFGRKSLGEIKEILSERNLRLRKG